MVKFFQGKTVAVLVVGYALGVAVGAIVIGKDGVAQTVDDGYQTEGYGFAFRPSHGERFVAHALENPRTCIWLMSLL